MARGSHYLWALLITIAIKAVFAWSILSLGDVLPKRDAVMVNSHEHTAEIRSAIAALHLPDIRVIETGGLRRHSLVLAILTSASSVASTSVIFLLSLWFVRKTPPRPGQI
jgi:hypothetical protein